MSAFYFEQLEKHIDYDFSGLTDPRNMIYDLEHHKPIIEHNLYQMFVNVSIVPGVEVPAIRTQIGTIPIHLTPFIKNL